MERTLQEQIEEHDYQLDDLDDLEEQTIFSPLDDAQIKIFKIGTIVFYLVAYFYTAILVQLKTIYSLPVTIGLLLSNQKITYNLDPIKRRRQKIRNESFFHSNHCSSHGFKYLGGTSATRFFPIFSYPPLFCLLCPVAYRLA